MLLAIVDYVTSCWFQEEGNILSAHNPSKCEPNYTERGALQDVETGQHDQGHGGYQEWLLHQVCIHNVWNPKIDISRSCESRDAYLTAEEEHELVDFLLEVTSVGFPRTRKDILAIVQNIVSSRKSGIMVTMGWMDHFIQRHPEVALRTAIPLSKSRAKATDPEALMKYFKVLETCFIENEIVDPDQCTIPMRQDCQ